MDDTEDTDPIVDEKADQEDAAKSRSLWLRILGGVILSVAVGFVIYGLTGSAGTAPASQKEAAAKPIVARLLTNIPIDESRSFQYFELPNGLRVVNVQDSRALQMAFAVAVEAGSFSDPIDLPGLAHFCEHMLFLGTKKYSEATSFDNFVAANGGINNAYTSEEVTVYFASVSQDVGAEGLDHFADFFKDPLFKRVYVEKEVHAIDSEHAKNVQNPERQVLEVLYSLGNKDSPISRFHTGNVETLLKRPKEMKPAVDVVAKLNTFWENYYCPNHMTLVTVGSSKLRDQMDLVKEEFSQVKPHSDKCQQPVQKFESPPAWPKGHLMKWINVQGGVPKAKLWLMFPLPDVSKDYKSQPLDYIDYMLTYGGKGSLARVLKDQIGLASSFETMYDTTSAGTNLIFVIHLTKVGRKNIRLLLDVLFAYLAELRSKGIDRGLYDSLAVIDKIKWDWDEPDTPASTATEIAERMTRVDDPTKLLSADALIERPNTGLVKALMDRINPENMNIAYINPKCIVENDKFPTTLKVCSGIPEDKFFEDQDMTVLPYFGVKYSVRDYATQVQELNGALPIWTSWLTGTVHAEAIEKHIEEQVAKANIETVPGRLVAEPPRPIEHIPKAISLRHMHASFGDMANFEDHGGIDALLYGEWPKNIGIGKLPEHTDASPHTDKAEVWYRSGWVTTSPKVQFSMALRPLKKEDEEEAEPISDVLLELYGRLLGEEMAPKLVDLTVTGVSYEIDVGADGLSFGFVGFKPSMPDLVSEVLSEFNRFNQKPTITPQVRFARHVHQLQEDLTTYSDLPLNYAIADRNLLLTKGPHARHELLHELNHANITLDKVATSVSELLLNRKLRVTSLAMGNLDQTKAQDTVSDFLHRIEVPDYVKGDFHEDGEKRSVERVTPIVNIQHPVEVRKLNPRIGDHNDVVVVSIVAGPSTVETRVNLGLISQMLQPLAYDELRTNRQLGYIVNAGVVLLSNVQLISMVVQGKVLNADLMESAVQGVLTNLMPKRLKELTDKEFQQFKSSFRQELIQPPTAASEEFEHFSGPVDQGGKCFDLQHQMLRYLDGPLLQSKETLIQLWNEIILPSAGERKKVVIKYFAGSEVPAEPTLAEANKTWVKEKIPSTAIALLTREYNSKKSLTKVDSQERHNLVKQAESSGHKGYFSTEQHCMLEHPEKSAVKGVPEVPEQVRNLVHQKTQDMLRGVHLIDYVPKVNGTTAWAQQQRSVEVGHPSSLTQVDSRPLVRAVRGGMQHRLSAY